MQSASTGIFGRIVERARNALSLTSVADQEWADTEEKDYDDDEYPCNYISNVTKEEALDRKSYRLIHCDGISFDIDKDSVIIGVVIDRKRKQYRYTFKKRGDGIDEKEKAIQEAALLGIQKGINIFLDDGAPLTGYA